MPTQLSEQLMAIHPALHSKDLTDRVSGRFEFSYEFAYFMNAWGNGHVGDSPYHYRNFFIAQRKSCFNPPLINDLGYLTDNGRLVYNDAKHIMAAIRTYHDSLGQILPNPEELPDDPTDPAWDFFSGLDHVLLYGVLSLRALQYLTLLYTAKHEPHELTGNLNVAQTVRKIPKIAGDGQISYALVGKNKHGAEIYLTEHDRDILFEITEPVKKYMLTGSLHRRPTFRREFETLVRYGFVTLHTLPKKPHQTGRGRGPVGAMISPMGARMFRAYVETFDPNMIAYRTMMNVRDID